MKKQIGLFLNVRPFEEEVFQYGLSLLEALASLPREKYKVVVVRAHQGWAKLLTDFPDQPLPLHLALCRYASDRVFYALRLPIPNNSECAPFLGSKCY
jgi:hypothetical protein